MKKIAFVSTMDTNPWGGSEELWSKSAGRMVEEGFIVGANVMGWKKDPRQIEILERAGCHVTRRGYRQYNIFWRTA